MFLLSESVSRLSGKMFQKKYVSLGRIISSWEEIVGPSFAQSAHPVKIHYRKQSGKSKTPNAILDIATTTATATRLHYHKAVILEKLKLLFGDDWVTDIRFVPMIANTKACSNGFTADTVQKRPLKEEEKIFLSKTLVTIEDDDIKQRLNALGEAILQKEQS